MIHLAASKRHGLDDRAKLASLGLIKNVLVGLTMDLQREPASSAVPYAISLAVQARAHLTVVSASIQLGLTHGGVGRFAQSLVDAENKKLRDLAEAAAEAARQSASAAAVVCDAQAPQLDFDRLLTSFIRQARTHDLIVLDAEPVALALDRSLIEGLVCDSGRPLIVVPEGQQTFSCRTVIVAWDGSAKAARGLNDAMPLLGAAERIELVTVAGEKDLSNCVPGAEAARHLARHGLGIEIVEVEADHGDVAETLRRRAIEARADLMVMGAFVHARFRQLILGGTTQSLLGSSPVPLFLSY